MDRNRVRQLISIVDPPLRKIEDVYPDWTEPRNNDLAEWASAEIEVITSFCCAGSFVAHTIQGRAKGIAKSARQCVIQNTWPVKKERCVGRLLTWYEGRITHLIED